MILARILVGYFWNFFYTSPFSLLHFQKCEFFFCEGLFTDNDNSPEMFLGDSEILVIAESVISKSTHSLRRHRNHKETISSVLERLTWNAQKHRQPIVAAKEVHQTK